MEQYLLDELAATAEKLAAGSGPLAAGLVSLVAGLQQLAGLREMEAAAAVRGRELLRGVLQLSLDLQAAAEVRVPGGVSGADGITRRRAECGHDRRIATVLGEVRVSRIAYRAGVKGVPSLFPRDAVLNLPPRSFSWELQRLAVLFARDVPYGRAAGFVEAVTGVRIGTRQIQEIVLAAAADADAFRQHRHQCQHQHRDQDQDQDQERERERERDQEREREREAGDGVPLVISADGKGVAMRPEARRAASVAPQDRVRVFEHRAGTGEKGCKRMAETSLSEILCGGW